MKIKSILLGFALLLSQIVFSQDEGAHELGNTEDGDEPGPFTKYGWIIIVIGVGIALIKNQETTKNNK